MRPTAKNEDNLKNGEDLKHKDNLKMMKNSRIKKTTKITRTKKIRGKGAIKKSRFELKVDMEKVNEWKRRICGDGN